MRWGADVRVKLEVLRSPRSRGTPERAGDLHGGPCLPWPLQGSVWGAKTMERNLVRNPKWCRMSSGYSPAPTALLTGCCGAVASRDHHVPTPVHRDRFRV